MSMPGRTIAQTCAVVLGVAVWCSTQTARAYVRTALSTGAAIRWEMPRIELTIAEVATTSRLDRASVERALDIAAAAWNGAVAHCSSLSIVRSPAAPNITTAARDDVNAILVRHEAWCRVPATSQDCYNASTTFVVSSVADRSTAALMDTDVEVNAVHVTWGLLAESPKAGAYDLPTALVRAIGHVIGLDANCARSPGPATVDHQGRPSPPCTTASDDVKRAVMYPLRMPGEIVRALSPDEVLAACTIYPRAAGGADAAVSIDAAADAATAGTPGADARPPTAADAMVPADAAVRGDGAVMTSDDAGCSCAVPGGPRRPALALVVTGALAALVARRRARRGSRAAAPPRS